MSFSFLKKLFGGSVDESQLEKNASAMTETPAMAEPSAEAQEEGGADAQSDMPERSRRANGRSQRRNPHRRGGERRSDEGAESQEQSDIPSASIEQLQEFVRYVVASLVDKPEVLSLDVVEKDRLTVIRISCEKSDIGKIVGKSGKTISAIRTLISGVSGRYGQRVTVDVLD